jgi:CubicO group peptidase (beta-lactamase class C family)
MSDLSPTVSDRSALPRDTPEAHGVSSSALLAFVEAADESIHDLHSLMLVRHGHVVAEGWWRPYGPAEPHMLFSLSKSFTSTAAGIAIEEGRLSLDDPVLSYFPQETPAHASENLAAMRVRHLLSMSTGHAEDTLGALFSREDGDWASAFLSCEVAYSPGTHFVYNSGATYMVAAILQRLTGQTLVEYLRPRLFEPLAILDADWETCPRGVNTGGWGLSLRTEEIARFGQLYLQRGEWNGQRLLSTGWVSEATARQVSNGDDPDSDWTQGYGYQFWRSRHNAYRGDGAFGQYCIVFPEQDAVLAVTAGTGDMQAVLNLVWDRLLPALDPTPLPADSFAHIRLSERLEGLTLRAPHGMPSSPIGAHVSSRRYVLEPNDQGLRAISFEFSVGEAVLRLETERGEQRLTCGRSGEWAKGVTGWPAGGSRLEPSAPRPVAASGAWTADDTYEALLCFYRTPFCLDITARFIGDRLTLDQRLNVSFGPAERPRVTGRADP